MSELITTGTWMVKPGEEAEFVEAWMHFAEWASIQPGATILRLGRDAVDTSKFVSFAPWEDAPSVRAWKSQPEFGDRIAKVKMHTTSFHPLELEVVAQVAAASVL